MAAKTKRRGGQRGCGKCKKRRSRKCIHRGGCGSCIGGGRRRLRGGNGLINNATDVTSGISGTVLNVFRGFQGQPPIPFPSF